MNKGKIFIGLGVGIVLLMMLAAASGTSTPKTIDQFINNYNKGLEKVIASRFKRAYKTVVDTCLINKVVTNVNGIKMQEIYVGDVAFMGRDYDKSFTASFAFNKKVDSKVIFSIIEAAILAAGDDYNSVMKSLGIMSGNQYSIPGEYNKEITFNKNKYFLTSIDDMILLNISIPK